MGQKHIKSAFSVADIASQQGKVFFITGANTGLGLESAKVLASKGATVVMAVRNIEKSAKPIAEVEEIAKANGGRVESLVLDLGDLESVRSCAENFRNLELPLNCLMNNAGVMMCPYGKTKDGFETQFGVNHLGHFALTAQLWPSIVATAESDAVSAEDPVRIVNLSSSFHAKGPTEGILFDDLLWEQPEHKYTRDLGYGQSKFANVLFTKELRDRLEDKFNGKIVCFVVHPGFVDTELTRHKEQQYAKFIVTAFKKFNGAFDVHKGALTQIYCATSPDCVAQSGEYFVPVAARSDLDPKAPKFDKEMQQKLWEVSQELTKVEFNI